MDFVYVQVSTLRRELSRKDHEFKAQQSELNSRIEELKRVNQTVKGALFFPSFGHLLARDNC